MLVLAATTDKFQVLSSSTADLDVHVSYIDINSSTGAWVGGGKQNTAINTATTTDVLAAPAATTLRNAKTINIRNKHASASNTVTFQFNQNATLYELHKVTLAAGEALEYIEGVGFFVLGAISPNFVATLASDQSNSTATATEVTGLSTATAIGNFYFKYLIVYQSGATTTGVKFSVNYDGTVTTFVYNWYAVNALATAADGNADQDVSTTTGGLFFVNAGRAKSTAGIGASVSVDTANSDMFAIIEGLMIVTVAGNIELWHASETTAISTVKAGSSLILTKTG
jgi:hypothetical protein